MKKIYISMKFKKNVHKDGSYDFKNDFREKLLNDNGYSIINPSKSFLKINGQTFEYVGPFYNEKASNGILTSTDCQVVTSQEKEYIEKCDCFLCVFDKEESIGGASELIYAATLKKEIKIYYDNSSKTEYSLKNNNWFAIMFAKLINPKTTIQAINEKEGEKYDFCNES